MALFNTPSSYTPNKALAILGVVLFFVLTIGHSWLVFRPRRLLYLIPLPIATILEVIGYIARTLSAIKSPYNIIYYVIQYFSIVVAPVILAVAIYVTLSRMIALVGRKYSPILTPKQILSIFIVCDVVATIMQICGAAMIGAAESNNRDPTVANNILLAGLAFQVASFAVFMVLLTIFIICTREVAVVYTGLRKFSFVLLLVSFLVWIRTIFRLAETSEGYYGSLSTNEVIFGVLEFAPIVVAIILLGIWHPGRYVEPATKIGEEELVERGEK